MAPVLTRRPTTFRCALCGSQFTHGNLACSSCPLHRGCSIVICPSCGYGFPRRSALVAWITRWLRSAA